MQLKAEQLGGSGFQQTTTEESIIKQQVINFKRAQRIEEDKTGASSNMGSGPTWDLGADDVRVKLPGVPKSFQRLGKSGKATGASRLS